MVLHILVGRRMRWSPYLYFPHSWGNVQEDEGGASRPGAAAAAAVAKSEERGARSQERKRHKQGRNKALRLHDEETTLHEGTDNLNQGGRLAAEPFRVREGLSHVVDWPAMISYGMIKTPSGHRGTRRIETIRQITATAAETRDPPCAIIVPSSARLSST